MSYQASLFGYQEDIWLRYPESVIIVKKDIIPSLETLDEGRAVAYLFLVSEFAESGRLPCFKFIAQTILALWGFYNYSLNVLNLVVYLYYSRACIDH